jgi:chemotaxis response regulator CheB
MDHAKLEDYTADSSELADWVPTSPSLTTAETAAAATGDEGFSWNGSETGAEGSGEREFSLDTDLGIDIDLAHLDFAPTPDPAPTRPAVRLEDEPILQALESDGDVRFSSFSSGDASEAPADLDADVAALAAQLEAFEKTDTRQNAVDPDFAQANGEARAKPAAPAKKPGRPPPPPRDPSDVAFPELSLEPIADDAVPEPPPIVAAFPKPEVTEFGVARKSMSLSLEGEGLGAVLILAGLGGPDAVRQLLSSLPDKLSVPVLLYQHLEVGKHERLVEQLAKISKLPVELAGDGDSPVPGRVSLLPAGMSATALEGDIRLRFAPGALADLIAALPPRESMIVVLSGADVQLVPLIAAMKDGGGLVLAQDPEVCFDAAAAEAIRKQGAAVYPALGLAQQIRARWPL